MKVLLSFCLLLLLAAPQALACGSVGACAVGDRSYRALVPPGWDGEVKLPVLVHFHGWGRQGKNVLNNKRITGPAAKNEMLLVAPDGINKSWSFWGGSDRDVVFLDRVIEDVAMRFAIDRNRIFVSGFSYGGAMAWQVACLRGDKYAGYLPIAGGLWRQSDVDCTGPVRLAHVHGLDDNVYGLPIGPLDQIEDGVLLWRRMNGVIDQIPKRFEHARYDCLSWSSDLTLCTHEGGHFIPKDWLGWMLPRMLRAQSIAG